MSPSRRPATVWRTSLLGVSDSIFQRDAEALHACGHLVGALAANCSYRSPRRLVPRGMQRESLVIVLLEQVAERGAPGTLHATRAGSAPSPR